MCAGHERVHAGTLADARACARARGEEEECTRKCVCSSVDLCACEARPRAKSAGFRTRRTGNQDKPKEQSRQPEGKVVEDNQGQDGNEDARKLGVFQRCSSVTNMGGAGMKDDCTCLNKSMQAARTPTNTDTPTHARTNTDARRIRTPTLHSSSSRRAEEQKSRRAAAAAATTTYTTAHSIFAHHAHVHAYMSTPCSLEKLVLDARFTELRFPAHSKEGER